MKANFTLKRPSELLLFFVLIVIFPAQVFSQTCPTTSLTSITTFPNTYYPATQASAPSGTKTIDLGPAGYGSHAIVAGDILLVIQMQGAAFNAANWNKYGDNTGSGRGYTNNSNLLAGNTEYVVAKNSVPITGGTLTLQSSLKNSYINQAYNGSSGQYTYQVIHVPVYYDLQLGNNINVPAWNGSTGGVLILNATDNFEMGGYTINGAGAGFRGGGSRALTGANSGNGTDYMTLSTVNNNAGKGEGIAGTPRFVNNNGALLDYGSSLEGYPSGAEARGAPGTAGGGGTDYDPKQNDQNSGGGGGGNGGIGGTGGDSWSSGQIVGGVGGAAFAQVSPARMVLGGGGGGGTNNNGTGGNNGFYSSGTAGGGIVMIYAGSVTGWGTIDVSGVSGYTNVLNDGSGGGGAGGSVLIYSIQGAAFTSITVNANGGAGGSNSGAGAMHGPGGGGAGGIIYSNRALSSSSSATGGAAGTTFNNSNYGATTGNTGVIKQNISSSQINSFPLGSCTVLPVNFLSFTAQPANGNVVLNWVVESQTATGYTVERSFDGNNFDPIATLSPEAGNNPTNSYTYTDRGATSPTGALYYRIKEEDVTGQEFYSSVVVLKTSSPAAAAGIYPNPARESFILTFTSTTPGPINLRLFDLGGRLVLNRPFQAATGVNAVTVDGLSSLTEGMYLLQWSDGSKSWTTKVIIRR